MRFPVPEGIDIIPPHPPTNIRVTRVTPQVKSLLLVLTGELNRQELQKN